jgi:carotenoid cleavage dioxygenase
LDATATPSRSGADTEARDAVLQHDLARDTCTPRRLGAHHRVGEFVFVPHDAGAAEDDGVLMGFVYNTDTDRSDLTLLDAATLDTIATVHLAARVPHDFHGNWLSDPT